MKKLSNRLFRFLHIWTENVEQIGTVIGVMFFLLLFQWNITQLDLHRRHIPLLKALCLILVALFHFLHTILEPQLLQVAMQTMTTNIAFEQIERNRFVKNEKSKFLHYHFVLFRSFSRIVLHSFHHRHVYTCLFLLILLSFYIILLWNVTHISTWLLAITAFLIELIVRLLASLGQYTLHILDAHRCLTNADLFDEYIFRIKAMTGIFEFILGVFLLGNGIYIFCYEARGALRAFILAIHAYMNIVKNFRRGWEILRNRRSAWDNVKKLPLANEEQINEYNDICSICHESLTIGNTCITPCVHFFHQKCLQKVFYATLNCALCSRTIIRNGQIHQQ